MWTGCRSPWLQVPLAAILSMDISLAQIGQELLTAPPAWTLMSTMLLSLLLFLRQGLII